MRTNFLSVVVLISALSIIGCRSQSRSTSTVQASPTTEVTPAHTPVLIVTQIHTSTPMAIPPGQPTKSEVYNISISPDGKLLALSAYYGVRVYILSNGEILYNLDSEVSKPYQGIYSYIAWSPDSKNLAIGKPNHGVRVWDVESWKMVTEADDPGHAHHLIPGFAWSPDGSKLALGMGEGVIRIWDRNTNVWRIKTGCKHQQVSIAWDPDGQLLIFSHDGLYYFDTCSLISNIGTDAGYGYAVWSPDMKNIYIFFDLGGGITGVDKYDPKFGTCCYSEVAWSYDGRYFAATSERSNEINVWDTVSEKVVVQEKQGDVIYAFAWSPGGELLALGSIGGNTVLWNINTRQVIMKLER